MADKMTLYVWKGDFGLVTLELDSLLMVTYCKIANAPVNYMYRSLPVLNSSWNMPILQHNSTQLFSVKEITKYLCVNGYDIDKNLSPIERSESLAVINLLDAKVKPAVQFLWWLDRSNFETVTRKWYWHLIPFPVSYFYVNAQKARAELFSDNMFLMDDDLEVRKNHLSKQCNECFDILDRKLRDKDKFFCGEEATYVDAVLFAHLAPIVKVPFCSDQLKRSLVQYEHITRYVERVAKQLFPSHTYEDRYGIWKQQTETDTESLSKANIIMSVAMVSVTMIAYGVSNGIIRLPKFLVKLLR